MAQRTVARCARRVCACVLTIFCKLPDASVTLEGKMMGTPCALSARICSFGDWAAASACSLHRRTYDAALGPSICAWPSDPASCCSGYCTGARSSSARPAGRPIPPAMSSRHAAATPPTATAAAAAAEPERRVMLGAAFG